MRGLKYIINKQIPNFLNVAPLAGAWIEITVKRALIKSLNVAPLAGAWIEILGAYTACENQYKSHPSRVRGLKLLTCQSRPYCNLSHPSRVRGLKLFYLYFLMGISGVAPLAGAWIEIRITVLKKEVKYVAPLAGAWIEIKSHEYRS